MTEPGGLHAAILAERIREMAEAIAKLAERMDQVEQRLQNTLEVNHMWDGS